MNDKEFNKWSKELVAEGREYFENNTVYDNRNNKEVKNEWWIKKNNKRFKTTW